MFTRSIMAMLIASAMVFAVSCKKTEPAKTATVVVDSTKAPLVKVDSTKKVDTTKIAVVKTDTTKKVVVPAKVDTTKAVKAKKVEKKSDKK